MDDPLLHVDEKEALLFDMPADMKKVIGRKKADYVARYVPCADFDRYQPLFELVHAELKHGRRSLVKVSKTASLVAKHFYMVDGVMLYLESIEDTYMDTGNHLMNGRTRCIFENGTETDILLQTLRKNVVGSGYGITETQEETDGGFMGAGSVDEKDLVTGYIYVLGSLSADPQIAEIPHLYKIGFTTSTVEDRIAGAEKDPTYLRAPVKVEACYKIVNMNSHLFETLVHQVLDVAQMQLTVYDDQGKEHHPREWFAAPLPVVDAIIKKILDGTIINYTYNPQQQCLEKMIRKKESAFDMKGLKVLTLIIKKVFFDEIMSGEKTIEYRQLKQTTLNKYTYLDAADDKRYLRRYDLLRLYVGYSKDRESALVEVTDTTYNDGIVEYHLGRILEHVR